MRSCERFPPGNGVPRGTLVCRRISHAKLDAPEVAALLAEYGRRSALRGGNPYPPIPAETIEYAGLVLGPVLPRLGCISSGQITVGDVCPGLRRATVP